MFADLVGFTALTQADEAGALRWLDAQRRRVRPILVRHHGREVKTTGDGFLAEFPSALEAVECALEIQAAPEAQRGPADGPGRGRLRIGIHLGDVVARGSDVLGDAVNIASRLEPLADAGGICVSQQVADQVANKIASPLTRLADRELKNVRVPVGIYKVEVSGTVAARPAAPPRRRLAVLPMENIGHNPRDDYLVDGLTEELIVRMARLEGLHLLARTSIMRYKGTTKTVGEIARELGVEAVVEGSVRVHEGRLRIAATLVDARTEEPVWSQTYDRELRDVFEVQRDIAERIAGALQVRLAGEEVRELAKARTLDPEAYAAYLRGRYFWNRRTDESLRRAIVEYREALRRDPTFALAHAGLADVYAAQALLEFVRPNAAFPLARQEAERAIALDPGCAEAFTSLGVVRFQFDRDWVGSEAAFRTALELSPNYPPAHHQYADLLKALGRFDEALREIRAALELDPFSLAINTGVGHVLYLARRHDEAIAQYRRTLELDPSFVLAHLWFGRPYLETRRFAEAIAETEQAFRLSGGSTIAAAVLAHVYASAGRRTEALALLEELRARSSTTYVPSYWIGLVYVGLGDDDAAFTWFDRAFAERSSWLAWVMVEPRFDRLRRDPRFADLLRRMNLPAPAATGPLSPTGSVAAEVARFRAAPSAGARSGLSVGSARRPRVPAGPPRGRRTTRPRRGPALGQPGAPRVARRGSGPRRPARAPRASLSRRRGRARRARGRSRRA